MQNRRSVPVFACLLLSTSALTAQQSSGDALKPKVGSDWEHVKVLAMDTKLHVTTDHGSKSCRVFVVTDEALTCANSRHTAGAILPRTEIKRIRLTHYVRTTLIGAGIGGGMGAIAGGLAGRSKPCPVAQGLCLNGVGIGAGGVAAIFGLGGALLGSIVGGVTDTARGGSIYTRP